jgi:phosphate transport system substrate-binding protein
MTGWTEFLRFVNIALAEKLENIDSILPLFPRCPMTVKNFALSFTLLFLVFSGCGRSGGNQSGIQIKGSDTMVNLGQAWAEDFMKTHKEISVAVTGGGSGTGISALLNGTCDIAEVSREMKESEIASAKAKGFTPNKLVVALDGLAVIVHPSNPLSQLTVDQLADVFTGRVRDWKEIGGTPGRIVLLSREVNSGTHVYFKEHILRKGKPDSKDEFAAEALLLPSSQAIADEVAQNPNAIGYFGMGYITAKERALKIASDAKAVAVSPTIENVQTGKYPISRPLLMYTRGEPTGNVKIFIDFVLSPEGQQIVKKIDFVPITK